MGETEVHSYVVTPCFFPHSSKPCLPTSQIPQVLIATEETSEQKELCPETKRLHLHVRERGEVIKGSLPSAVDTVDTSSSCPPTQLKLSQAHGTVQGFLLG